MNIYTETAEVERLFDQRKPYHPSSVQWRIINSQLIQHFNKLIALYAEDYGLPHNVVHQALIESGLVGDPDAMCQLLESISMDEELYDAL